jgi:hypothetical protein
MNSPLPADLLELKAKFDRELSAGCLDRLMLKIKTARRKFTKIQSQARFPKAYELYL